MTLKSCQLCLNKTARHTSLPVDLPFPLLALSWARNPCNLWFAIEFRSQGCPGTLALWSTQSGCSRRQLAPPWLTSSEFFRAYNEFAWASPGSPPADITPKALADTHWKHKLYIMPLPQLSFALSLSCVLFPILSLAPLPLWHLL